MISMTIWDTRVYFPLIQFFLQFNSKVYRAKTAFVFHILLPWQHLLWYERISSPFVALSLLFLRPTLPLGLLLNAMRNVSDVLNTKSAILVLQIGEFNPGFLAVCSKALCGFSNLQTDSATQKGIFLSLLLSQEKPNIPKMPPSQAEIGNLCSILFLWTTQKIRNNLFHCLRIVPAAPGWQEKKPYCYPTQHILL